MATAQRKNDFYYGILDDLTGEALTYAKVTKWANGQAMTDSLVDGAIYKKIGTEYFKRVVQGPVNVLSLGVKNDDSTRNQAALQRAMELLPPNTTFFFPQGTYRFGPLPARYNCFGVTPVAIHISATGAHFVGEQETVFKFDEGCIGVQLNGGTARGLWKSENIRYIGPGSDSLLEGRVLHTGATKPNGQPNPDAGRTLGDASLDYENYQFNGINGWGQFILHNCDVQQFSGHGVCIYGSPEVYMPGVKFDITGTLSPFQPPANQLFTPDDPGDQYRVGNGWKVTINGATAQNTGYVNQGFAINLVDLVTGAPIPNMPTSGKWTATIEPRGGALIADNSQITGVCNFDYNGGCGLYMVGADGNQTNVVGLSVRENGLWGIDDNSFLGSGFYGCHGTRNGRRINKLAINNIFGHDYLPIGSFRTRSLNARSFWSFCYSEQGNQGNSFVEANSVVIGGLDGQPWDGPGLVIIGSQMNNFGIGRFGFNREGLTFTPTRDRYVVLQATVELRAGNQLWFTMNSDADANRIPAVGQKVNVLKLEATILERQGRSFRYGPPEPYQPTSGTWPVAFTELSTNPQKDMLRFRESAAGAWVFGYGGSDIGQGEQNRLTFAEAGHVVSERVIPVPGLHTSHRYLGARLETVAATPQAFYDALPAGAAVRVNDQVSAASGAENSPLGWVCVQGGVKASLPAGVTANGNGPTFQLSQGWAALGIANGAYLKIGNFVYQVTGFDGQNGVYVSPGPQDYSQGQSVQYATPKWRPLGTGLGTTAQRPNLAGFAGPWPYFNTELGKQEVWTGSAWVFN